MRTMIVSLSLSLALAACGGGGGGGGSNIGAGNPPAVAQSDFDQGIFRASGTYKDLCANPRPASGDLQGSTEDENDWLRAWTNDTYLWYDEVLDEDPALYATPAYFDLMRTFATTPSGSDKDQFHFTYDTEEWEALSQSGINVSYGANITLTATTPPREAVIALVTPGSPADVAGITRGTLILEVDGVDLAFGNDVATLNAGLFPASDGETHTFLVSDYDGSNQRSVTVSAAQVVEETVPVSQIIPHANGPIGYMVFTSFLATAEARLVDEIQNFAAAGITELVLDIRYNGGGFLDIASELAYMIAGTSAAGQIFEQSQFNDKHPSVNPVTGATLSPSTFHSTTQGFSLASGQALPTLNLSRVFVLSGSRTGSASESVINGLLGIDFPVILIGGATTGKPYGFYPTDNCGTTYFSIQFRGVNAKGFGDFPDGLVPSETPVQAYDVQGCEVADDFGNALGDTDEARLATALGYVDLGDCSAAPVIISTFRAATTRRQGAQLLDPRQLPGSILTRF